MLKKIKTKKEIRRVRVRKRVRKSITGTSEKPRMSVFRSNKEIYVQLIDDINGTTLLSSSTRDKNIPVIGGSKKEKAELIGKIISERAMEKNITTVVFDRNGYLYHGRVKVLAEAARKNGLKF